MSVSDSAAASRSADSRTFFIIEDGAEVTINDFTVVVPAEVASLMDITVVSMDNAAVSAENYVVNVTGSSSESAKVTGIAIGPQTASGNINIVNSNPGTVTIDPTNGSDKEIQDSIVENNPDIPSEDVSAKYDAATAEDFIKNLAEYGEVRLTADIKAESIVVEGEEDPDLIGFFTSLPDSRTYDINLNGHVLDITTNYSVVVPTKSTMSFRDGDINLTLVDAKTSNANLIIKEAGILMLDQVDFKGNCAGIGPNKDSTIEVKNNSTVSAYSYGIATNASTIEGTYIPKDGNVTVKISNSIVESQAGTGICFNVTGLLEITENSTIKGDGQAVMLRGGTGKISDSTLYSVCVYDGNNPFEDAWESGNMVPFAALLIGNNSNSYRYPTECTVSNTTITMDAEGSDRHTVYIASSNGKDCSVTVTLPDEYADEVIATDSYRLRDPENDVLILNGVQITVNP